eukprot:176506_1
MSYKTLNLKYKKLKPHQVWNVKNPNILELDSDVVHEYASIHIHEGCTLTVKPWLGLDNYEHTQKDTIHKDHHIDPYKVDTLLSYWNNHSAVHHSKDVQQLILNYISSDFGPFVGGRLLLRCKGNVVIDKGAKIEVDSCGYTSGTYYTSGESCRGLGKLQSTAANLGGGGAGLGTCGAGGGGYATKGGVGQSVSEDAYNKPGLGGNLYGTKYLTVLHLGSGGGGSECNVGGDGGGAILIECDKLINYGSITSNGGHAMKGAGAGSGGSIHIIVNDTLIMNEDGLIQAKGGYGGKWGLYANGGHGRIRIDINKTHHNQIENIIAMKRINPPAYVNEI